MVTWGGIADDFTGATDLAGNWVARGLRTVVTLGVPDAADLAGITDADAVVIALKSRTAPVREAVRESLDALAALRALGCTRYYQKYCSTFDSTPAGNIGPVTDALLAALDTDRAVVVPAFPDAGRTVYQGHLFVGDRLLSDSSMRHHPLTPMTRSDLPGLLGPQTSHGVAVVPLPVVRAGAAALGAELDRIAAETDTPVLLVVDAVENADLAVIARATAHHPLVTGGSGLALGLPATGEPAHAAMPVEDGHRVILAGSASTATRAQIAHARAAGVPARKLDLAALRADPDAEVDAIVAEVTAAWAAAPRTPFLVYAVGSQDDIQRETAPDQTPAGELVEAALADCARRLADAGARQFIVAGGETSGSVVRALDVRRLEIGPALAPGVSWARATTADGLPFNLALKSGNFGATDIFTDGWQALD
ncbi:four-carbon acid sugar kinase family protein [Streptomyces sp. DSM 44915]|uniref:3-oxo-tetronate kinase n=1 Tax=Streptomyces chisholmiae TaxID=3075540 RepID=A0ABU2JQL4_9ACTN|nr:3-oxo-tetronate kinase [Streptomyces sp. DSM 44915]MDT0267287.1 four-carbon acid sugar kinase family protein [Streptomyces sp. DSM 44915]